MSEKITRFFASRWGIILTGAVIGILASLLQYLRNPPHMGICVACFIRDIAGGLGLHRATGGQYVRPEIIGFVLGSTISALLFREFKARAGSAPLVRFVLGFFAMIGALLFLGCPWGALLRLAGGNMNAILALAGLVLGIFIGIRFLKAGFNLGRAYEAPAAAGWIMPVAMIGLLLLRIFRVEIGRDGALFFSQTEPGSAYAPLLASLGIGLFIGFLAQRTRFCTMAAFRNVILMRDTHLLGGVVALVAGALVANLIFGQVISPGDPYFLRLSVPLDQYLWSFVSMVMTGLAFTLAGGCAGRQVFLSGEGDGDAAVFVLGMFTGAACAHNFGVAERARCDILGGIGPYGVTAIVIGLVVCLVFGFTMREKEGSELID